MTLVEMIDSLIDDIGKEGLNEATVRSRLVSLLKQAKTIDLKLQRARADLKRLKENAKAEEQDSIEDVATKLLQLLSRPRTPSLEQMASQLGIKQVVAQYHANLLVENGLIKLSGATRAGLMYFLTPKGTAYVVKNELA
jgi:predicted HTH transcriptional regulator